MTVATNGHSIDEEMANGLIDSGIDTILASIDATQGRYTSKS